MRATASRSAPSGRCSEDVLAQRSKPAAATAVPAGFGHRKRKHIRPPLAERIYFYLIFSLVPSLFSLMRSGRAGRPFLPPERDERPPRGTLSMGSPLESPPYRPKGQRPFGNLPSFIATSSGMFASCQRRFSGGGKKMYFFTRSHAG